MLLFYILWYLNVLSMSLDDNIALFGIIAVFFTGFFCEHLHLVDLVHSKIKW